MKLVAWFVAGGPVMYPILALSVAGLTILFWNALRLRRGEAAKGLVFVSTIITAEPMLGILGTVTGIMQTFGALNADASHAVNPMAATAGIGEALVTTAAGLVASLVLLFPYNWIASKANAE